MIKIDDVDQAIELNGYYQVPNIDFELGIEPNDQFGDYEIFCWPRGVVRLASNLNGAVKQLQQYIKENFNLIWENL